MSFRQMAKLGHFFSITEERLVLLFVGRSGMGNVWLAAGESGGGGLPWKVGDTRHVTLG